MTRARPVVRWLVGALAGAALWSGCSIIVSPGNGPIRCELMDAGDPCPEGLRCINQVCVVPGDASVPDNDAACVPSEEICNERDDDCDGLVNEGHDLDEDTFTWCGDGRMAFVDCNDRDPTVHPAGVEIAAAAEVCDGQDNDCDGSADEMDAPLCPAGQVCTDGMCTDPMDCTVSGRGCTLPEVCDTSLSPPRCRPGAMMGCLTAGCPSGFFCVGTTGMCVASRPDGDGCGADLECASGVCAETSGLRITGLPPMMCQRACCADADCAAEELCWAPGSGVRTCLPRARVGGALPVPLCTATPQCSGSTCRLHAAVMVPGVADLTTTACGAPPGGGRANSLCGEDAECQSNMCIGVCTTACGSDAECNYDFFAFFLAVPGSCAYYYNDAPDGRRDVFTACAPQRTGDGQTGATCGSASDCRDAFCIGGQCADVCCNDSQCPPGRHCRPRPRSGYTAMLCLP